MVDRAAVINKVMEPWLSLSQEERAQDVKDGLGQDWVGGHQLRCGMNDGVPARVDSSSSLPSPPSSSQEDDTSATSSEQKEP